MKIFNNANLTTNVNSSTSDNQPKYFLTKTTQPDTFVKSASNNVSFKQHRQLIKNLSPELAGKIIKNPEWYKKFMDMIGIGLASAVGALFATAIGEENKENETSIEANPLENIPNENLIEQVLIEQEQLKIENEKYKAEIEALKEENLKLKEENIQKTNQANVNEDLEDIENKEEIIEDVINEEISADILHDTKENSLDNLSNPFNNNLVNVEFPKKRGRLSKEVSLLKEKVIATKLPVDLATKLTHICKELLDKKKVGIYDVGTISRLLTMYSDNIPELEHFINDAYDCIEKQINQENKNELELDKQEPSNSNKEELDETKNSVTENTTKASESEELYKTPGEIESKETYKTLDENIKEKHIIDLPKTKDYKFRPRFINRTLQKDTNNSTTSGVNTIDTAQISQAQIFVIPQQATYDSKKGIIPYKHVGTISDFNSALNKLLLQFRKDISNVELQSKSNLPLKLKLTQTLPVYYNEENLINDIKNEIIQRNDSTSPYHHIDENQAEILAEVINSDPRFKEYFTLHSALRLIDRFVDLKNEENDVETQTKIVLDNFFMAIEKAIKNGLEIEIYQFKDKHGNKTNMVGARMVIKPDRQLNPEAFNVSGNYAEF